MTTVNAGPPWGDGFADSLSGTPTTISTLAHPSARPPAVSASNRSGSLSLSNGDLFSLEEAVEKYSDQPGKDIAPYELFAADACIAAITSFLDRADDHDGRILQHLGGYKQASLADALIQAAETIRFNAKWFSGPTLYRVIASAVNAVRTSASSAELHAALGLLNTVTIYSVLEPRSLPDISRLLAYVYHQGFRSNRSRKLAQEAWAVVVRLLQSHLGAQLLKALLSTLGSYAKSLDPKEDFAVSHGALAIVARLLFVPEPDSPVVEVCSILHSLQKAANATDTMLREDALTFLTRVLAVKTMVAKITEGAGWDAFFKIASKSLRGLPEDDKSAVVFLDALQRWETTLEPRLLPVVAVLCVSRKRHLSRLLQYALAEGLLKQRTDTKPDLNVSLYDHDILMDIASAGLGPEFLDSVAERSLDIKLHDASTQAAFEDYVNIYCQLLCLAKDDDTTKALGMGLVRTFVQSMSPAVVPGRFRFLFRALCDIAPHSPYPAKMLFRLRADAVGHFYFQADASSHGIPSDQVLHTATTVTTACFAHWLDVVANTMQSGASSWDIYTLFATELSFLLANHKMFEARIDFVKHIKDIVVDLLRGHGLAERMSSEIKPNIIAKLVQLLTVAVSYHRALTKDDILGIIAIFVNTAGYGDFNVSKNCIHGLTICCYEVPHLMSNVMDSVIDKMSKMITQRYLGIHVLQFLASLSRLPRLYSNFTQRDFMRIFGVCQSYLRSTRGESTSHEIRRTPTSDASSNPEDALPEYVYALAHHVMTFWYIAMSAQNRQGLREYVTRILTYHGPEGEQIIEDQGVVTIDMMDRIDADEGIPAIMERFERSDGRIITQHRLAGLLLITTETSLRTSRSLITVRRPSGTSTRLSRGAQTVYITAPFEPPEFLPIVPTDTLGTAYGKVNLPPSHSVLGGPRVVTLPEDDDGAMRGLQALDRIPALDSHKAGVIYIGENQATEDEIFQNVSGSPDYRDFVQDLGTLQRLRGASFNTQGLDRQDDVDGEHAIVWNNRVTELVFHVTTMMPNHEDTALNTSKKKRHIGNDFVNIVFNNSGARLTFETLYNIFPSAFGYVYIVITPSARTSFVQARTVLPERREAREFRVKVLTKPDYPNVSPASEEKVVSGSSLAAFVRDLALNDCVVSLMKSPYGETAEYPSSWRARMAQLRRMYDRYRIE